MPSLKELENPSSAVATEVYASDGSLLGKFYIMNRSNSKYSEISQNVIHALVATEDERFTEHSGIDGKAVMRAVFLLGSKAVAVPLPSSWPRTSSAPKQQLLHPAGY